MEIPGKVRDILRIKGRDVLTTTPDCSVYDAIRLMGEKDIGALIVVEDGSVAGVLSERDYSRKVVLRGRTSRDTKVGEILSRPAITVTEDETIEECMRLMTSGRLRHLPVIDENGALDGVVSIGDLVNWMISSQRETIDQLHNYISGRYPA